MSRSIYDKLTILLILIGFSIGLLFCCINWLSFDYPGNNYLPMTWLKLSPLFFLLGAFAIYAETITPRTAFVIKAFCLNVFVVLSMVMIETGVQFTPFAPIDKFIVLFDKFLGFNTVNLLSEMHWHPHMRSLLLWAYNSDIYQIIFLPIILGIFNEKRSLYIVFWAAMISAVLGLSFYYFFPTTAPASIFSSPFFMSVEHDTFLKFQQIHQHIAPSTDAGGMVAFPSFHVMWAVFFTYAYKNRKWIFVPALLLNGLMILSTVFLGWHYLADVFAGVLLASASIICAEYIYKKIG